MKNTELASLLSRIDGEVQLLLPEGRLPAFIPQLAKVNQLQFGIAFAGLDGRHACSGDAEVPFSIQSISKLFALEMALDLAGDDVWSRVAQEPSGMPFNDLLQVDQDAGAVRNPFINAGALVVTDILCSRLKQPELNLLQILRQRSGDERIAIDQAVKRSERETCHRNASIGHLLKSYGRLENSVDTVLDSYCGQCAVAMSCLQIARSATSLASTGSSGPHGPQLALSESQRQSVIALMLTCGMYNAAGSFAARVGLPMKSGSGGGVLAVIPGVGAVCAWSPGLDSNANSLAAGRAIELFAQYTGWSVLKTTAIGEPSDMLERA